MLCLKLLCQHATARSPPTYGVLVYYIQEKHIGHNSLSKKTKGKYHGKSKSISLSEVNFPSIIEDKIYYVQDNVFGHNSLSKKTEGKYHGKNIRLTRCIMSRTICSDTIVCHRKRRTNIMARALVCQMTICHRSLKTRFITSRRSVSDTIVYRRKPNVMARAFG